MKIRATSKFLNHTLIGIGVAALLVSPATQANFIQNAYGLSDEHSTISFDEHIFPSGTAITNQYADLGVNFAPFAFYDPYPGGGYVSDFMPHDGIQPLSLIFEIPQKQVAFNLMTADQVTTSFYAYLGNVLVESASATTVGAFSEFYGFNGIEFDQVYILTTYSGGFTINGTGPLILDNLQLSNVPIPASICLFGSVLGWLGFFKNRRLQAYINGSSK
jgi:hypothetical protein